MATSVTCKSASVTVVQQRIQMALPVVSGPEESSVIKPDPRPVAAVSNPGQMTINIRFTDSHYPVR